jgi:hypothetical protein
MHNLRKSSDPYVAGFQKSVELVTSTELEHASQRVLAKMPALVFLMPPAPGEQDRRQSHSYARQIAGDFNCQLHSG